VDRSSLLLIITSQAEEIYNNRLDQTAEKPRRQVSRRPLNGLD